MSSVEIILSVFHFSSFLALAGPLTDGQQYGAAAPIWSGDYEDEQ